MSAIHSNKLNRNFFIKNKKQIDRLFSQGNRLNFNVIRLIWICDKDSINNGVSLFVSVPKRFIRKANKRNLIKRRIKEALRLNLSNLHKYAKINKYNIQIGIVYFSYDIANYQTIENKIVLSLQDIYSNIKKT